VSVIGDFVNYTLWLLMKALAPARLSLEPVRFALAKPVPLTTIAITVPKDLACVLL